MAEAKATGQIRATESDIHRVTVRASCADARKLLGQHSTDRYYPPQTPETKAKAMHHLKAQQCRNKRRTGQLTFYSFCCFLLCCYLTLIHYQHPYSLWLPVTQKHFPKQLSQRKILNHLKLTTLPKGFLSEKGPFFFPHFVFKQSHSFLSHSKRQPTLRPDPDPEQTTAFEVLVLEIGNLELPHCSTW